ncbi:ribonuclease Oy-like [Oppia nitens]|uniref:ribonuclease Oy-like n=1 Tax=Oppia nitens TaxID=1686743 RepID=UPI0023DA9E6D|nr:ribonuclease Oy-like [Oppia nitens]
MSISLLTIQSVAVVLLAISLTVAELATIDADQPLVDGQKKCTEDYDFDYILLANQWPEAFCETNKCTAHRDVWSIHGGWPQWSNTSTKWPQNCCFEREFDSGLLDPIKPKLLANWRTLKSSGTDDQFWSHEWQTHGTCAMRAPLLRGELNYFQGTLKMFDQLALDKWLSVAGIVPSMDKAYEVSALHSAIESALGRRVAIECLTKKHNNSPILSQLNVCIGKDDLRPIDCPDNVQDKRCGSDTVAYLPSKN